MDIEEIQNATANWYSNLGYCQWEALPVSGSRPVGRYKHAAAVVAEKLYVCGGSRNGRHLSDIQVLDLTDLTWSPLKLTMERNPGDLDNGNLSTFPPTSGHDMIVWGKRLLIFGGLSRTKSGVLTVWFVDLDSRLCGLVETSGEVPVARRGHSVSLVGSKLILFGGEDNNRLLLNDVHILDLDTMTWHAAETTQPPPSPRYDHSAAVHAERYLLLFGGSSHSTCFNDLYVLDLQTMEWSEPEIRGDFATPRAGHCGVIIDENWFVVGGGDNRGGSLETLVLDMTRLAWSAVTRVGERHALASEGIRVCSALIGGEKYMITFGGYNGKYNNEVFVMRPKLRNPADPKIYQSPAAAAAAASVSAAYSIGSGKPSDTTKIADANGGVFKAKHPFQSSAVDSMAMQEEKRALETSLAEVRQEVSTLRAKVDDANSSHVELSKELLSVQAQVAAERSRCFKLEAQIAELQSMLQSLPSIEATVLSLRGQISALEKDVEQAAKIEKQGSRGVWQWFGGGASDA